MRRVWTALLAVGLLVGGGAAFSLVSSQPAAEAQEDSEADDQDVLGQDHAGLFGGVLADLVESGVISQDQADAITDAFRTRVDAFREEFQERREELGLGTRGHVHLHFHPHGFGFGALLNDGVIDADELAELGDDHPLNDPDGPAAEYLDDGQLTQEEIDELKSELVPPGLGRRGFPFGHGSDDDADAAEGLFSS